MPDLGDLVHHWGYPAIFLMEVLGNLGLPIPEETLLAVAGYLVWQGRWSFWGVMAAAVSGAVVGDNVGYWLGRRYGRQAIHRRLALNPARVERTSRLVERYGMLAVFFGRLIPGVRAVAGLLAGAGGLSPLRFFVANLTSALVYVPLAISAGYAVGYGFGDQIEHVRRRVGGAEPILLAALGLAAAALWWAIALRIRRRP